MTASAGAPILRVTNLTVNVVTGDAPAAAVDDLSFDLFPGEVLGIVGESGSGKSITMLALMGLLSSGSAAVTGGRIVLGGRDLYDAGHTTFRGEVRGRDIAMIFQEPMTSLNPVLSVGSQIATAIRLHQTSLGRAEIESRVIELLRLVGVPDPERRIMQYPHEYSGGMRQRVMIAMAIANEPKVLIADEPTTALDVTVQAQIMDVLGQARARTGAAMLLVTHDLGLIAENADRVAVMYGGQIVETGTVQEIFASPSHPYTIGLMRSLPSIDDDCQDLYAIPGQPPAVTKRPAGCVFHPRCEMKTGDQACATVRPEQVRVSQTHASACHHVGETVSWSKTLRQAVQNKNGAP
ncbi:MAG: ABC transporter ATP-binding protein [Alsobacter sp.]